MANWRDETMKNVNGLIRIDNDTGVFIDYNTETYRTVEKNKDNIISNDLKSLVYKETKKHE